VNRDDTNAPKIKTFLTARQKGVVFRCRVILPSATLSGPAHALCKTVNRFVLQLELFSV
jgi:hypothetical protein